MVDEEANLFVAVVSIPRWGRWRRRQVVKIKVYPTLPTLHHTIFMQHDVLHILISARPAPHQHLPRSRNVCILCCQHSIVLHIIYCRAEGR